MLFYYLFFSSIVNKRQESSGELRRRRNSKGTLLCIIHNVLKNTLDFLTWPHCFIMGCIYPKKYEQCDRTTTEIFVQNFRFMVFENSKFLIVSNSLS